jgi:uncharacterized protein HemY
MSEPSSQLPIQALFDVVVTGFGFLGGWVLGVLWREIKDARAEHAELLSKLPETYARRDDVADALKRLEDALDKGLTRIFDRLDGKADKPLR